MLSILSTNLCHQPSPTLQKPAILYFNLLNTRQCAFHSMARADCHDTFALEEGDIKPKEKSFVEKTIEVISTRNSKDLIYGRTSGPMIPLLISPEAERPPLPPPPVPPDPNPQKPLELFRPNEELTFTNPFFDKPTFLPKVISHSRISPSSIPNPSPSISTNKHIEPGYPNYGSYLYSIPGYSAFQPVSYPGIMPSQTTLTPSENSNFVPYSSIAKENRNKNVEEKSSEAINESQPQKEVPKPQTDFEDQFTPEIVPAVSPATTTIDSNKNQNESKMCITSLAQGSGATVTISSQISNKELNKKKPQERISLKTSIPISKIDMKCVSNPPDPILTNSIPKKTVTFSPVFSTKSETGKIEIKSNIVIKGPTVEIETTESKQTAIQTNMNNNNLTVNNLINVTETVNKNDSQFKKPEPKNDVVNEIKDPPPNITLPNTNVTRPVLPINIENNKVNLKSPEGTFNEQKNQILLIQNKNQNPKMLLTIQQQNPQVLLQRTNFESKNVQVPSRLSSQNKNCKEEISENGTSSKVVALKRLHQENCDENDFENLITENQIYGNKIVVKEKLQRTLQEQELKNRKTEKVTQETKNVVIQPNIVYLSNVQFPANLMMIKNNTKVNQSTETNKVNKVTPNDTKTTIEAGTMTDSSDLNSTKNKTPNVVVSKEIHVLKSSNNVLQTLSNMNSKSDMILQPNQKVIMNPQIVYQVPMIVDGDNKFNQPFITNREYQKILGQNKKEFPKPDQKSNEKLYIACPYQVDSNIQPKIVITNIRPKVAKIDEVSSLDIYEKRKRLCRLKNLSNRDNKEVTKLDNIKKVPEKLDIQKNLITPDKINEEICKEFANTKRNIEEDSSDSETDYDENDLNEYKSIIKKYGTETVEKSKGQAEFLAHFNLGTQEAIKEKELDRQERIIRRDSVASAYIAVGRLDRLTKEDSTLEIQTKEQEPNIIKKKIEAKEGSIALKRKQIFLSALKLAQVTPQFKEGYEKVWQEIIKERKRRDGVAEIPLPNLAKQQEHKKLELDPNGQLQILTEIKKFVNENNNLIKKKLDITDGKTVTEGESIHMLAEKNFTELNRLSKMADRSVKLITGQDAQKGDLPPGFDNENIQKPLLKYAPQPMKVYPKINVPSIDKIISLKSQEAVPAPVSTSQATSMDEPVNSAAGAEEVNDILVATRDFGCQVEETVTWPGLEALVKSYRDYEAARRKEINELHRRNTAYRVDGAHITRGASRDSDQAKALLAERQHVASEESAVTRSLQKLMAAIDVIKNYS